MNTCRPQPVSAEIWGETKLITLRTFVVNKGHASAGTLMTSDYWRSKVHADWGDGYIVNCQSGLKSGDINQTSWPMILETGTKKMTLKSPRIQGGWFMGKVLMVVMFWWNFEVTGKEPWGEVSCRVDRVSAVEAEANTNCEHCQTDKEGHQLSAHLLFMFWIFILP